MKLWPDVNSCGGRRPGAGILPRSRTRMSGENEAKVLPLRLPAHLKVYNPPAITLEYPMDQALLIILQIGDWIIFLTWSGKKMVDKVATINFIMVVKITILLLIVHRIDIFST